MASSEAVLTEDLLAEEAADALAATENEAMVDAIRRRFDRQLGLLRALPEGWKVYRGCPSLRLGTHFTVYDARGSQVGQARRLASTAGPQRRQCISWAGASGASPGDTWAQGIALLLAAIDAEARGDAGDGSMLTEHVAP